MARTILEASISRFAAKVMTPSV